MEQLILELFANIPIAGGLVVALLIMREEVRWLRDRLIASEEENMALTDILVTRTNLTPQAIRDMLKNGK